MGAVKAQSPQCRATFGARPLLMIAGTKAHTARFSREAIENARQPKELFWIDGANQVDLYDRDPYVSQAVEKMRSRRCAETNARTDPA